MYAMVLSGGNSDRSKCQYTGETRYLYFQTWILFLPIFRAATRLSRPGILLRSQPTGCSAETADSPEGMVRANQKEN